MRLEWGLGWRENSLGGRTQEEHQQMGIHFSL